MYIVPFQAENNMCYFCKDNEPTNDVTCVVCMYMYQYNIIMCSHMYVCTIDVLQAQDWAAGDADSGEAEQG